MLIFFWVIEAFEGSLSFYSPSDPNPAPNNSRNPQSQPTSLPSTPSPSLTFTIGPKAIPSPCSSFTPIKVESDRFLAFSASTTVKRGTCEKEESEEMISGDEEEAEQLTVSWSADNVPIERVLAVPLSLVSGAQPKIHHFRSLQIYNTTQVIPENRNSNSDALIILTDFDLSSQSTSYLYSLSLYLLVNFSTLYSTGL